MKNYEEIVARDLLSIGAVSLQPKDPFTWASGMISPIYTDNRLTIAYPIVRTNIADGLAELIAREYPQAEVIAGTATAGIPHAAWVADRLNLPMVYVRSKPKDHGQGRQVEGRILNGANTVVIDDLISTGGSVLKACEAAKNEGANVVGVAGIFSYELNAATENFAAAGIPLRTLTGYSSLIETAETLGRINAEEKGMLAKWRQDPTNWQD